MPLPFIKQHLRLALLKWWSYFTFEFPSQNFPYIFGVLFPSYFLFFFGFFFIFFSLVTRDFGPKTNHKWRHTQNAQLHILYIGNVNIHKFINLYIYIYIYICIERDTKASVTGHLTPSLVI